MLLSLHCKPGLPITSSTSEQALERAEVCRAASGENPGVDLAMCSFGVPCDWLESSDIREVGGRDILYSRRLTIPEGRLRSLLRGLDYWPSAAGCCLPCLAELG